MKNSNKLQMFSCATLMALLFAGVSSAQTVLATYDIHDHASGLAYDGRNIWYGRYGTYGEWIYKFDTVLEQIVDSLNLGTSNLDDAYGLTWDGQYLWVTNHIGADFTLQFDTLGTIVYSFQNPSDYMSGLAWNGSELYMADYYNPDGAIYRVTTGGLIVENFPAPDTQPWDLAWDGSTLWMCDYWSDWIYQIDPVTHQVLFSFPTPITEPAGITWDGNYLWVCDEGQGYSLDHLYKIDPFGGGTPQIQLSTSSLPFGFVALGLTPHLTLSITNVGDADLTVTDMPIDQFGGDFWVDPLVSLPFVLSIGTTVNVDIYYGPLNFGSSSGLLHVQSDDPINPDVTVDLSGYGIYPDQTVSVSTTFINFGAIWVAQGDALTGRPFEIYNLGALPLNLISLVIDDPAFFVEGFQSGPLTSMDTLAVTVFFMPEQAITYTATMTLTTDDPATPTVDVFLSGVGVEAAFNQGDVIWQYQATEPATFTGFNSLKYTDDVNGDQIPEMLGANENYLVYCWNGQSAGTADVFWTFDTGWDPLRTGPVEYQRGMVAAPDLNGDGIGDVALGTGGGSRTIFAVSGANGTEIWQLDTHNFGGQGGWVYEVSCEDDWNNDGVWDVLAAVGGPTGSSDPKSVFLLSGPDGSLIWRAHLGETVYSVRRLEDVDNDGYAEVVCGTSPGTTTYYVKRLNGQDGSVDWNHQVDNVVFSLNRIDDLNGDNVADVAVAAALGGVYALSGSDGSEIWHVPSMGINYYLEVTEDLNGNGYDDILVTSVSGTFYALEGADGSIIWSLPLGSNVLSLAIVPDVTGDGIDDACCGIMSGSFYAVSGADGSVLFSYTQGGGSSYAFDAVYWLPDIDNSGAVEFVGSTRDGYAYCFSGGDLAAPPNTVEITIEPVNPPIIIPPGGGSFQYTAQAVNVGGDPTVFDYWVMVTLPNGSPYGPVFLRSDLQLAGGASINRTLTQAVPPNAPAGDYTYIARVGNYDLNDVWDEDSFQFSKSGVDPGLSGNWSLTGWDDSEVAIATPIPQSFELYPPIPNPFNPTTKLSFILPEAARASLSVYDISGCLVATLVNDWREAGSHEMTFDASKLSSGIYFVRLTAGGYTGVQKLVLLK